MLIAQSPDGAQVGAWVLVTLFLAVGMLTVSWLTRQLWLSFQKPERAGDSEYVTKHELLAATKQFDRLEESDFVTKHDLAAVTVELKSMVVDLKTVLAGFVGRAEYEERYTSISKRLEAMDQYMHSVKHDILNGQQLHQNKLETISSRLERWIGRQEAAFRRGASESEEDTGT